MSDLQSRLAAHVRFPQYVVADGLWVITTYFNPCRYETRRENFEVFAHSMRAAGIPMIIIECAFGDQDYELPDSLDVVRIRAQSLLWQKERLLNLAAKWLPPECRYVAWLDCDILFKNANWAVDAAELLKKHAVVQLFETCLRFQQGNVVGDEPDRVESFGAVAPDNQHLLSCGRYDRHGHTGYGWAMRREIFDEVGLYEHTVAGSADHYMAHAIYDSYGFCVEQSLKNNPRAFKHLQEWGKRFYRLVRGNFGVVPGEILHLWHGELRNRRYLQRMLETNDLGFDPFTDVLTLPGKPMEWHPDMDKQGLKDYMAEYFRDRREDG